MPLISDIHVIIHPTIMQINDFIVMLAKNEIFYKWQELI